QQMGQPFNPMPGNLPGVQRDVMRTAANGPIQSPGTDPPAPPVAAAISAPAMVTNSSQTSVPVMVTGPAGSTVTLTVTDGTTTVTTTGTVDPFGELMLALNLSALSNATLTTTASVGGTLTSTTLVKSVAAPGAAGISAPAYANIANQHSLTINLTGTPGMFVAVDVSDGAYTEDASGYLDPVTGTLAVTVNLVNLAQGNLTVTATT